MRETLNLLPGRTGAAGDAVVLRRDLVQSELAGSQTNTGNCLHRPARSVGRLHSPGWACS
ncbi:MULTISPECIES: hypothetical protein [unclassified Endozoicomonas]|uniref:hypothetical protein n=1 Tax=unclassified Endozoicomonas TaxID=2644528 RepID=UPI003BB54521